MYNYKDIRQVHLEPSSLCNAECPVCNRRLSGGPKNPFMIERCITLDEFKQWFPVDFLKQLDQLLLCGNYGDPMTNPYLIDILSYFREQNPTGTISMNTNAGGRNKKFWKDLSEIIGEYGRVVFSVDGLEDTNHLYRKGVAWNKVMDAMISFTSTKKAMAVWEFLVFEHNQHQISEARELSKELGFEAFWAKKAMGFNDTEASSSRKAFIRVLKPNGKMDYEIYAPDDEWKNEAILQKNITRIYPKSEKKEDEEDLFYSYDIDLGLMDRLKHVDEERVKELDKCEITCIALNWDDKNPEHQSIFVDSTGLVFPCCFTGSKYNALNSFEGLQLREFVKSYGEHTINLNKTDNIKNIMESDIMQNGWVDRWKKSSIEDVSYLHVALSVAKIQILNYSVQKEVLKKITEDLINVRI